MDFLERYRSEVEKVTSADVTRVAQKYLHKDKMAVLVVGNEPEFGKAAQHAGNGAGYRHRDPSAACRINGSGAAGILGRPRRQLGLPLFFFFAGGACKC